MLKINIKGTNLELTPSIYTYIEQKVGELDKFINVQSDSLDGGRETVEAFVEVGRTSQHHRKGDVFRAEIQIRLPGAEGTRTVSERMDLHQAIDEAKDEMQRQLKRYKGKRKAKFEKGRRAFKKLTRISRFARFRGEK